MLSYEIALQYLHHSLLSCKFNTLSQYLVIIRHKYYICLIAISFGNKLCRFLHVFIVVLVNCIYLILVASYKSLWELVSRFLHFPALYIVVVGVWSSLDGPPRLRTVHICEIFLCCRLITCWSLWNVHCSERYCHCNERYCHCNERYVQSIAMRAVSIAIRDITVAMLCCIVKKMLKQSWNWWTVGLYQIWVFEIRPEPEPDLGRILFSDHRIPDETNGIKNAVGCYEAAVLFSASFVTSLFASFWENL